MSTGACPECGREVDPGSQQFCPNCDYPLVLERKGSPGPPPAASDPAAATHEPAAAVLDPAAGATAAEGPRPGATGGGPGRPCPSCGTANDEVRVRCARCGAAVGTVAVLEELPPAPPVSRTRLARDRWPLGIALLALLAVLLVVGWLVTQWSDAGDDDGAAGGDAASTQTTQPAGAPVLQPVTVTGVAASSTLPPDGELTWDAANLVDADCATAWNSRSDRAATESLRFDLAEEVDLVALVVVNGYAANAATFRRNTRVERLVVVTDTGKTAVELADTADPQVVRRSFGRTRQVVLDVESVVTGSEYTEVALTDVAFGALPAAPDAAGSPDDLESASVAQLPLASVDCG